MSNMTGRELVNQFYQPLGQLRCKASSDEMWAYAKARALEMAQMCLDQEPMYTGNLNPQWSKWNRVKNEIIELL